VTVLDRNVGTFNTATSFNVTRSTGSFGTGTVIVVAVCGNTVINTPSGWTQRTSSVVTMGFYSFDKTGAGESSIAFTCSTGTGQWFVWELSAGSTWLNGSAGQGGAASSYATPSVTPTAGDRHMLAAAGGLGNASSRTVTAWSNSFTEWADTHTPAQDWPFAGAADLNVTANGSTGYTTTATFSATTFSAAGGMTLAYINNAGSSTIDGTSSAAGAGVASATVIQQAGSSATGAGAATAAAVQRATATASGAGVAAAAATTGSTSTAVGAGSAAAATTLLGAATAVGLGTAAATVVQLAASPAVGAGSGAAVVTLLGSSSAAGAGIATGDAGGTVTGTSSAVGAGAAAALAVQLAGSTAVGAGAGSGAGSLQGTSSAAGTGVATAAVRIEATATAVGAGVATGVAGSRTTPRPFTGTTIRPFTGTTVRP
jgi:hypothetical protein